MSHAEMQAFADVSTAAGDVIPSFDFSAPGVPATLG
jgi:hypothetical protein